MRITNPQSAQNEYIFRHTISLCLYTMMSLVCFRMHAVESPFALFLRVTLPDELNIIQDK